ncbi:MAG: hypothetical protein WAR21_05880 [Candidatus Acidiferrales bacterium]
MLVPMYAPSRLAAILKNGQAANRSRQANGRLQVILYMILLAAHLAVVWLLPFFPTQDGPSHVYNLVVYRDLLHGKGAWDRFYVLNERSISNQGFFLIAYPLRSVLPIIQRDLPSSGGRESAGGIRDLPFCYS